MKDWFSENLGDDLSKQLIRIKAEIDGQTLEKDVRPDVAINYEYLEDQLVETPSMYVFWGTLLAEYRKQVAIIERAIKTRRGKVTRELLDEANKTGVKLRASDVNDLIEADDKINTLEAKLIIVNKTLSKLFCIVDAIKMKSEHLRSLAGFKKQELRDN